MWIRFGCFLIGYNYKIVRHCSIGTEKSVRKYTSAILIICIIWGFIGYLFADRYLKTGVLQSSIIACILIFIVIQIERQIILTIGKNQLLSYFRGLLAIIMAVIGSILIDQLIFEDDVKFKMDSQIQNNVNSILPIKSKSLNLQITEKDSIIKSKENELILIYNDLKYKPYIRFPMVKREFETDSSGNKILKKEIINDTTIVSPGFEKVLIIQRQLDTLNAYKSRLESNLLQVREDIEKEQKELKPFLEELTILINIITNSKISFVFWLLLWFFFFIIEVLVLISKLADAKNDYEYVVLFQMQTRIDQLFELNNKLAE